MVKNEPRLYLFVGQDSPSKDRVLSQIKQKTLIQSTRDFNFDVLHCRDREFSLKALQEKLLYHAAGNAQRMVVLKDIEKAPADVKKFLGSFVKRVPSGLVLVLDAGHSNPRDDFLKTVGAYAQVMRFQEEAIPNTFALSRLIEAKKAAQSLELLHTLLDAGEKPERIMGGLRASWQRSSPGSAALKNRMKLLLQTDLAIKTGKVKPLFALERMIVALCSLGNLSG